MTLDRVVNRWRYIVEIVRVTLSAAREQWRVVFLVTTSCHETLMLQCDSTCPFQLATVESTTSTDMICLSKP